jgi:hypothetical protein
MICPAGRNVTLFNDDIFSQLRKIGGVPEDFVNEGWSFESLISGDAKSGCLMAFLGSEFVVKELSYDDHHSLLRITRSYFDHVRNGDTLLSAIFLHFEDVLTGRRFYAMRNVVGSGPFLAMYDLKGCNDDKTLEIFGSKIKSVSMLMSNAGRWCGYFGSQYWYAYRDFTAGKWAASKADLVVTEDQRQDVMRRIRRDTEWLVSHHLMDYSLLVGVKTGPSNFASETRLGQVPLVRGCADGTEVAVCVGIIDFLQNWNLKKIAARAIKCMECNKATIPPKAYATRFCEYFEDRFVSTKAWEVVKAPALKLENVASADEDLQVLAPDEVKLLAHSTEELQSGSEEPVASAIEKMEGEMELEEGALICHSPNAAVIGACVP